MAKVKHEFKCERCGRRIEYESLDAYCYDNELYCSADCAMEAAGVEEYDWRDDYEFDYTKDESNGYGVNRISKEWYGNGYYAVYDKCPFEFDQDYKEYFGVIEDEERLQKYSRQQEQAFDNAEFTTVKRPWRREIKRRQPYANDRSAYKSNRFYEILGKWYDANYYDFIMKQLNGGKIVTEQQIAQYHNGNAILLIISNGKRALLAPNEEPEMRMDMFDEVERNDVEFEKDQANTTG